MSSKQLKQHCELSEGCLLLMKQAMTEMGLSARAYDKVRRVARTIADLESREKIEEHHLAEAVQYRLLDRKFWIQEIEARRCREKPRDFCHR